MTDQAKPFWMVYGIGSGRPTHQHQTYEDALGEAKRLARGNLEVTFVVLEAVAAVRKSEFVTTTLRAATIEDDGIPF